MRYVYKTEGVCSSRVTVDVESGVIGSVEIESGCSGNLKAITALLAGLKAEDAIKKLRGIRCGAKATSCPDQISIALEKALREEGK